MRDANPSGSSAPLEERYVIVARVALGGMASLYFARSAEDGAPVAIKVMHPHLADDPHLRKMFLHEARLAERLLHPNMVAVHETGEDPEAGVYLVMEYIEGGTLGDVMKVAARHKTRLPPSVVARLGMDLCHALHAAHALMDEDGAPLHLVHRDVSPQNVLVGVDGRARLVDFGIAKSDDRYTKTRQGELKGKLAYLAPERLHKRASIDRRVDVFAAGVVLWEALLTRRLFVADSEMAVVDLVLKADVPPPSRFVPELAPYDEVIARATARDPEQRYATATDLADGIKEAAEAIDGVADRETSSEALAEFLADELARRREKIGDGFTLSKIEAPLADDTYEEADGLDESTFDELDDEPGAAADLLASEVEPSPLNTITADAVTPSRLPAMRGIAIGAVACVLLGVGVGTALVLSAETEDADAEPVTELPSFDAYANALAACRAALLEPDPAQARAQAQAALAERPGDAAAAACMASAENLQSQHDIFQRGQTHLDNGETHLAFNEFQRLPASSPYLGGGYGRVVSRAFRGYATERLRDAREALDELNDPDQAHTIANFVLDIEGITQTQRQQANDIVAACEAQGGATDRSIPNEPPDPPLRSGETFPVPQAGQGSPDAPTTGGTTATGQIPSPERQALECTQRGDNQCVVRALEGHARSSRAVSLLIEAYRAQGRHAAAMRHMRTYVSRWGNTPQGRAYQEILARMGG